MSSSSKDADGAEEPTEYPLNYIRGLPLPSPFLNPEGIEKLMDLKPLDDDIFIVTYPKCGTTWTQYLVYGVMNKGAVPPSPNQIMFHYMPFLEFMDVDKLDYLSRPRAMKTHMPFHLQPYNLLAKYIYIVRNPYDCCVSYYYHHALDPAMPHFSFDKYFELFIKGEVGWGDYLDHVLSWYPQRNDGNVLFLTYEEMKADVRKVLRKIAKFLGDSYYEDLQNDEVMENCVKHSDFKYLKQMGMYFLEHDGKNLENNKMEEFLKINSQVDARESVPENFKEVPFFRKGETGDWKNHFSQSQLEKFNEYLNRKLKNTEMENFWDTVPYIEEETVL